MSRRASNITQYLHHSARTCLLYTSTPINPNAITGNILAQRPQLHPRRSPSSWIYSLHVNIGISKTHWRYLYLYVVDNHTAAHVIWGINLHFSLCRILRSRKGWHGMVCVVVGAGIGKWGEVGCCHHWSIMETTTLVGAFKLPHVNLTR